LGNFFASSSSGVSSHTGIDDTPNTVGEYVTRGDKAWTQGNANPYAVAAELCAFAAWTPGDWAAHPVMLANAAQWVAEEAEALGIPLVALTAAQAQSGSRGVCQHVDLGAAGGGHWDCGPGFPIAQVVAAAAGTPEPQPEPEPSTQEAPVPAIVEVENQEHVFDVTTTGALVHRWHDLGAPDIGWPSEILVEGVEPTRGPAAQVMGGALHVFAPLPGGALFHAWSVRDQAWGTEILA
jgi:hypothetical protein